MRKLTTEEFIERARRVHGDKYDYSEVEYVNNHTKVKIICPKHGIFEQVPSSHLSEKGCQICAGNIRLTTEGFVAKAKQVHGDKYDYSKVDYVNAHTKVKIGCPKHGIFVQEANTHLRGGGCSTCNLSKGELEISKALDGLNVTYETQYKFSDCRNSRSLPFDFYLPAYRLCIEFDGIQHFKVVVFRGMSEKGAIENFQKQKKMTR